MRRVLRIVIIVLVLSVLVSGGILYRRAELAMQPSEVASLVVDETTAEMGDLTVIVSATGSIAPVRQVQLVFELNAPVVEILAETGAEVSEGDVLARMDATDYQIAVDDAQITVDSTQLALDSLLSLPREVDVAVAEAAVTAAQASYNAALSSGTNAAQVEIARLRAELARNQLWQTQLQRDAGLVPVPDLPPGFEDPTVDYLEWLNSQVEDRFANPLEQSEYGIEIAEANYAGAQNSGSDLGALNSANAGRIQAQIALDQLLAGADAAQIQRAQNDLEYAQLGLERAQAALAATMLVAPFDGVVAQNNLKIGQLPPSNNAAILLMDTSAYLIELAIDETDILQVQVGQPVTLRLDALPDAEVTGRIERVAVTPVRVGELVTYPVRVKLDPTDAPIRMGMSATARISTQEIHDALLVRNNFIRIDRPTQKAFVTIETSPGRFEEVEVAMGARNETFSQILSGLEAGQRVVRLPRSASIIGGTQTR